MPYDQDNTGRTEDSVKEQAPQEKSAEDKADKQSTKEQFSFLQETIKPKPVSREKIFMQFARIAIFGVVFGFFACCGFFALKPWAEEAFQADAETVTIPEDEEVEASEEETASEDTGSTVLTSEEYSDMMSSLYDIAREADKSVVSVRISLEGDWTGSEETAGTSAAGLIAADNGQELLILASNTVCQDAASWIVTFADKSEYSATLKKQDKNRGLAVFSIDRSSVSTSTWSSIQVASLGNSNIVSKGEVVIALGNMFGYGDGLSYGVISSTRYDTIFSDGYCSVIATDITVSDSGTGVLFNQSGQVIGMILPDLLNNSENTANALAVSDIKNVMEKLLNGESVPYIGIDGATISSEISESQDMPEGVYVTQVRTDSPAMNAGIQNGDIIQVVDGEEVRSVAAYQTAVQNCSVGENIKITAQRRGTGGYVEVEFTVTVGSLE